MKTHQSAEKPVTLKGLNPGEGMSGGAHNSNREGRRGAELGPGVKKQLLNMMGWSCRDPGVRPCQEKADIELAQTTGRA